MENILKIPPMMIIFTGFSSPLSSLLSVMSSDAAEIRKSSVTAGLISVGNQDEAKIIEGDLRKVGLNLSLGFQNALFFLSWSLWINTGFMFA